VAISARSLASMLAYPETLTLTQSTHWRGKGGENSDSNDTSILLPARATQYGMSELELATVLLETVVRDDLITLS
jgi:hypothetical protein